MTRVELASHCLEQIAAKGARARVMLTIPRPEVSHAAGVAHRVRLAGRQGGPLGVPVQDVGAGQLLAEFDAWSVLGWLARMHLVDVRLEVTNATT